MSRPSASLAYRPDVDGLRAVAVGMVLLYHAGLGFEGGYVGVDLFFVISGYLITALILKAQDAAEAPGAGDDAGFSLREFWARRVRRIAPAATAMTLVTLAVGAVVLLPAELADLGRSALWQQAMAANVWFYKANSSGYFGESADLMPLLHCWSLAVEEQFYLVVPLLLIAWRRLGLHRRFGRAGLAAVAAVACLGSLAAAEYGVRADHAVFAFYMLPCRAWELGIGSLLAILGGGERLPRAVREALTAGGLIGALACGWFFSRQTPFPGLWAAPPCLAAAAIILGGRGGPTFAGRLLSARPVVFVGLISYSLYLWHWPLLAFLREWYGLDLALDVRLTAVAVACALGALSWRFIETPFRTPRRLRTGEARKDGRPPGGPRRGALFAGYAAAVACVVVPAAASVQFDGWPGRCATLAETFPESRAIPAADPGVPEPQALDGAVDGVTGRLLAVGLPTDPTNPGPFDFLVWGDSHTLGLTAEVHRLAAERGLRGVVATRYSTPPVLGGWRDATGESLSWNARVAELIERYDVPAVLLVGRWAWHFEADRFDPGPIALGTAEVAAAGRASLREALRETVLALRRDGRAAFVMNQAPEQIRHVPRTLRRHASFGWDPPRGVAHARHETDQRHATEAIAGAVDAGAVELDAASRLFPSGGGLSVLGDAAGPYYDDDNHLSAHGGRTLLGPLIAPLLDDLAARRGPPPRQAAGDETGPQS